MSSSCATVGFWIQKLDRSGDLKLKYVISSCVTVEFEVEMVEICDLKLCNGRSYVGPSCATVRFWILKIGMKREKIGRSGQKIVELCEAQLCNGGFSVEICESRLCNI